MYIMPTKEFFQKLNKIFDLEKCKDENYKRNPTDKLIREEIYEEQKGKCWLCGCKTSVPIIHHIQPEGESIRENLVMLCPLCHQWVHWILKKYLGYRGTARYPPSFQ